MARTRSIRPEFWDDEKLAKVSRDSRLIFIGLWSQSDDFGVCKGDPRYLMHRIFPYDEKLTVSAFSRWLCELEHIGVIIPYIVSGERYYEVKNFNRYQKIDHPSKQRYPSPIARPSRDLRETFASDSLALANLPLQTETETETETETIYIGDTQECPPFPPINQDPEKPKKEQFKIPTIDEVVVYCKERKNNINPQLWFDHYTANGWMVGKNKMRDWKATVRTWEQQNYSGGNGNVRVNTVRTDDKRTSLQRQIDDEAAELNRRYYEQKANAAATDQG